MGQKHIFFTLLGWCLHNNKVEEGTSNQPNKAPVTKETRGGWSPTHETLGIIGGGVQSFKPTHPAEGPPTQTPPPPLQLNSYKRNLTLICPCPMRLTCASLRCVT